MLDGRVGGRRRGRAWAVLALALGVLLLGSSSAHAQSSKVCLLCHRDPDAKGTHGGREISIYVDEKQYAASSHRDKTCVDCHRDLAGPGLGSHTDAPEATEAAPVDCSACHEVRAREERASIHGQAEARGDDLAPVCSTCHTKHSILPHTDRRSSTFFMNIPVLCGQCHHEGTPVSLERDIPQDRILENYSQSIHGKGLYEQGLIVTAVCTSCHTSHRILPHTDPQSSISSGRVVETCTRCHANIEQVHVKVVEGRKWEAAPNEVPVCVECHAPHKPTKEKQRQVGDTKCLRCHGEEASRHETMIRGGETVSLLVDRDTFNASAHSARGIGCAQCHSEVFLRAEYPDRGCRTIRSPVDCSICHAEQMNDYRISTHGTLHAKGDPDAPACLDCHTKHATLSKRLPTSPTFSRNVPALCGRCHRAGQKAAVRIHAGVADIVGSYEDSIHGKGLIQSGLTVTATCASCHSAHRELPPDDPRSNINHANVADTCGQCHNGIEERFKTSSHWPGNGADGDLPTCKDCHSSHTISRTDNPDFRFRMVDQCGRCTSPSR